MKIVSATVKTTVFAQEMTNYDVRPSGEWAFSPFGDYCKYGGGKMVCLVCF